MKCPECAFNQKVKHGMRCGKCGYRFALSPKKPPYLSDMAFKMAVDRLTGNDQYYFTFGQLYAAIHNLIRKKHRRRKVIPIIFIAAIAALFLFSTGWGGILFFLALLVIARLFFWKKIINFFNRVSHDEIDRAIRDYRKYHLLPKMATGRGFRGSRGPRLDEELFDYAPERILIVEHDDLVDMLIHNRFPFENKTLVVGAGKYPEQAFQACQGFLARHPDIPVYIIHDVSLAGMGLQNKLISDAFWNLKGKNVQDLGLHSPALQRIKQPVWIPKTNGKAKAANLTNVRANIRLGFRLPVDYVPPVAMQGMLAVAVAGGVTLLSEELLAQQFGAQRMSFELGYEDYG